MSATTTLAETIRLLDQAPMEDPWISDWMLLGIDGTILAGRADPVARAQAAPLAELFQVSWSLCAAFGRQPPQTTCLQFEEGRCEARPVGPRVALILIGVKPSPFGPGSLESFIYRDKAMKQLKTLFAAETAPAAHADDCDPDNGRLPQTVDAAVNWIVAGMPAEDKDKVRATPYADLILYHHGWGTGIRNTFGLWSGNEALLRDCGAVFPDDASMAIIEAVWVRLLREALPPVVPQV